VARTARKAGIGEGEHAAQPDGKHPEACGRWRRAGPQRRLRACGVLHRVAPGSGRSGVRVRCEHRMSDAKRFDHRPLTLAAIYATTLGCGLIFGFQPPLIALILERGGASAAEIGLVNGITLVAVILFGPLYPYLIARLGLRRAVVYGVLLAIVVQELMPVVSAAAAWAVLRFVTGIGLGLTWIASEIWMNRISDDESRGSVMAIYGTVFASGVVAGPLVLQITGTSGSLPFHAGVVCLAVTLLPLLLIHRVSTPPQEATSPRYLSRLVAAAPIVMLAAMVAGLVESADISLLPVFGLMSGLDERASLMLVTAFLAGNVILQLPVGWLADRAGRRRVLAGCALAGVAGPLLLKSALPTSLLWPLLFVWGGTMYGFYTQGIALLGEVFVAGDLAGANTVFVMVYCVGGTLGPSLGGLAMDLWRPLGLVVFLSAAALLLLLGLLWESPQPVTRRGAS
jgi:MFS family permease